jgi:hypothetical protein
MRKYWLLLSLSIAINPLYAQIYKWTGSDGSIHFSDSPHEGAAEVNLPKTQTYSAPPVISSDKIAEPVKEIEESGYKNISILQPEDQVTIRNTEGYVSIIAEINPKLKNGDKLQVLFDGGPVGEPSVTPVFELRDINRGSHSLAVRAINSKGEALITSKPVTIFMMQPRVGMGKGAP